MTSRSMGTGKGRKGVVRSVAVCYRGGRGIANRVMSHYKILQKKLFVIRIK